MSSAIKLHRQLGVWGAAMMGLGSILGTGVFVSLAIVAGVTGPSVILACAIAAVLAACNAMSTVQLSVSHPVSGGAYEYASRYLNARLGFVAGWLFLLAKVASAATAALGFATYFRAGFSATSAMPSVTVIALITVLIMTAVAAFGLKQANVVNIAMVLITIGSLILFVITGFQANHAPIITSLTPFFSGTIKEFLYGVALAFVAYAGYGRIATLGEEVRYPKETIPKAIGLTVVISAVLYITVSLVAIMLTGGEFHAVLAENPTVAPLIHVAQVAQLPFSRSILVFGAMTAMLGVLLNLILGLSRTILAMGRRGDMPRILTRLNANRTTPYMAVLFVGVLILAITSAGDLKLAWTFSALNVLVYYSITNLAALKIKGSERFISPWVSRVGFVGCLFLSVWIESDVWILGSVLLGVGFMIRWVMRVSNRGLKTE